jgi:capsular exopolysaccharide synthesis family protein
MHASEVSGWQGEPGEERVELRRYLDALRRNRRLIALIVIAITLGVLLASLVLPNSYTATARLTLADRSPGTPAPDAESAQRTLATAATFVTSPAVLERASQGLDGTSRDALEGEVDAAVDNEANLIEIEASEGEPGEAATVANEVALAALEERRVLQQRELSRQRENVESAIDSLEEEGLPNAGAQLGALERRASRLRIQEATAGSDLQLAERAAAPERASSPRPVRNTVLALFASIFIAVLVALGREQLRPRASGPREAGRVLGLPVLGGLRDLGPRRSRRGRAPRGAERESYEALRNAVEVAAGPAPQVLVVTSAAPGEGKTTVVANLGRSLAVAGHSVLLVSGDLRRPGLHERFGLTPGRGVGELLGAASRNRRAVSKAALAQVTTAIEPANYGGRSGVKLHVVTSGELPPDPAKLLAGDVVESLLEQCRRLDYDYVLVDAPPLLGVVDAQVLARGADGVLVTSRLDTVTIDELLDARDVLERLEVAPLGVVVIGARVERYSEPPVGPEDAEPAPGVARLARRRWGRAHRTRPHEGGDDPQVAPMQGVDEQAVGEQPAPRPEKRR